MSEETEDKEIQEEQAEEVKEASEETPQEPDPERQEIEETAKHFGWKSKDEFTAGPPENWVDADRFLEMPIVRARIFKEGQEKAERENRELRDQMARLASTQQEAIRRVREQEQHRYESRIADYEARKDKAVADGDVEGYRRLAVEQQKIERPAAEPTQQPPEVHPDILAYKGQPEGKWLSDPSATRYAARMIEENKEVQALPPLKQVQWAEGRVKEFWPEYFDPPKPKPQGPSKVDPGGLGIKTRSAADRLPPDVKKVAQDFVKEGVFKSVDEYAKSYFEQGGTA